MGMTGTCLWYARGGCRRPCNFRDQQSCAEFTACEWDTAASVCKGRELSGGGVELVVQLTKKGALPDVTGVTLIPAVRQAFAAYQVVGENIGAEVTACNSSSSRDSLCRRFMEFVDRNSYKPVAEAAEDWTLAVRVSGARVKETAEIRAVSTALESALASRGAVMEDIHFNRMEPSPNILIMMADDLGWGDVGFQACDISDFDDDKGEKICSPKALTPHLDAMARGPNSLVFNRFYTTPICGPSRSSILTGREPIRECMLRNVYRAYDPPELTPPAGLTCTMSIAEMARHAGLRTFHAGKWHVGKLHKVSGDGEVSPNEPDEVVSTPGR